MFQSLINKRIISVGVFTMKKGLIITVTALFIILSFVSYFFIWGGEPTVENFAEVSGDYEAVAEIALDYYKTVSPGDGFIIINVNENGLEYEDRALPLYDIGTDVIKAIYEKFDFLRVSEDTVFFFKDETGYYGLVYSKNPLSAIYKAELPEKGRDYHRINSRRYEWGCWGI